MMYLYKQYKKITMLKDKVWLNKYRILRMKIKKL